MIPSDRAIVVERFRDEIGDWRLCVLSPFGGRVHAAWALALSARIRDELDLESDAIYSDDGIIVHLPDADEPPGADLVLLEPDEIEDLVVQELGASALFGARFRENAARALLIPRARPGKRTPLWQQRLKSQSLLEVAKKYGEFPVILETYRECLRDVLDVPGLVELLGKLHRREISLVEVETPTRVAVRVIAAVRLRRDVHVRGRHAERRAPRRGAVAGSRSASRAARAGGAARPDRPRRARTRRAGAPVPDRPDEGGQPRRAPRRAPPARGSDGRRGDAASARRGSRPGRCSAGCSASAGRRACGLPARSDGSTPPTPACIATHSAACPTGGLPAAFLEDVPDALTKLDPPLRGDPRTVHDRRLSGAVRRRRVGRAARARARRRPRPRRAASGWLRARVVRHRGAPPPPPRLARGAARGDRAGRPARAGAAAARVAGCRPPPGFRRRRRPSARGARPASGARAAR